MKTRFVLSMIMLLAFLVGPQRASAVLKGSISKEKTDYYLDISPEELLNKSVRTLHKESGNAFSLRERLTLRLLKNKLKKMKGTDLNAAYEEAEMNVLAVVGFSLAILSILGFSLSFPVLIPASIICSSIALSQIKKSSEEVRGKKLAKAGIILGILSLFIVTIVQVAFAKAFFRGIFQIIFGSLF